MRFWGVLGVTASQHQGRECPGATLGPGRICKYKEPQAGLKVPEKQQRSCGLRSPGLGPSIAPMRAGFVAGNGKQMEYREVAANIVSHRERRDSPIDWSICSCPREGMRHV